MCIVHACTYMSDHTCLRNRVFGAAECPAMCMYECVCVSIYIYIYIYDTSFTGRTSSTVGCTYMRVWPCVLLRIYAYIYIYICVCVYVYNIHTCVSSKYEYTHTHTDMNTYVPNIEP